MPWVAQHWCLEVFRHDSWANNPMASSLKGHTCSLPLRKRELFLRLLGCETNIISHCDLGGRHKVGAWKVGRVPSEKEDFLDQKGLGLVEDHLGWGSLAWTFQLHLASKEESPSIFHTWMSLQEWFWADQLQSERLSSSLRALQEWQPCSRVCPASGIPLEGTLKKKRKTWIVLNYYIFYIFLKDKFVNRVIWNTIWQSFIFDIL